MERKGGLERGSGRAVSQPLRWLGPAPTWCLSGSRAWLLTYPTTGGVAFLLLKLPPVHSLGFYKRYQGHSGSQDPGPLDSQSLQGPSLSQPVLLVPSPCAFAPTPSLPALPDASLYYLNSHPSSLKSTLAYPRHVRDALHLFDTHSGDCELLLEAKPLALDMAGT